MEMNIVERTISVISPKWALQRMHSRLTMNAYKGAQRSRTHNPNPYRGSPDQANQRSAETMRGTARRLEMDSDMVDGILTCLVNNVVGKDGIGVEPMPLDKDGNIHQKFAATLAEKFEEWSENPSSTGDMSRAQLERLKCRSWLRDGEVFTELLCGDIPGFKHPNEKVYFSLQAMESDYLPYLNKPERKITQGVERNRWGQVVRYHLSDTPNSYGQKLRPVAAHVLLHLKHTKRLNQTRGVSIFASSLTRIAGMMSYEECELVAARIAASMAFYIRKGSSEDYNEEEHGRPTGRNHFSISPGMIYDDLRPGEDVGTVESNRPNALLQKFRDTMLRMICSATGANFSSVSKQYDGTYSAQRQELVESYVNYAVLSDDFIASDTRPTYQKWVQMAELSGEIEVPLDVDRATLTNASYTAPQMMWIDPKKEAEGFEKLILAGLSTETEVVRKRGHNPQKLKIQRIREIEENRKNNLVFSSDHYHEIYGKSNESSTNSTKSSD